MPSSPCACTATFLPYMCAVSTIARASSSNICWPRPAPMRLLTPPVVANLITSTPRATCRRTARRQSSAPSQGCRGRRGRHADRRGSRGSASMWPAVVEIGRAGIDDARPRHLAGGDRIAQRERDAVGVAEIAHGGEAGGQRLARVDGGFVGLVGDALVTPSSCPSTPALSEVQVHVAVDQAGQDVAVAQVDDGGVRRRAVEGAGIDVAVAHRDRCGHRGSAACSRRAARGRGDRAGRRPAPAIQVLPSGFDGSGFGARGQRGSQHQGENEGARNDGGRCGMETQVHGRRTRSIASGDRGPPMQQVTLTAARRRGGYHALH